jgi:hypothetical protein
MSKMADERKAKGEEPSKLAQAVQEDLDAVLPVNPNTTPADPNKVSE